MTGMRVALAFALATSTPGSLISGQAARTSVAVLPFENGGSFGRDKEEFDALRLGLAAVLGTELSHHPAASVIERDRVRAALVEQGLAGADRLDAATAVSLGRRLGARYVAAGTYVDLYGDFRIDARIIDVESGEVLTVVRSDPKLSDRQQMFRIIQSVAERIMESTRLPPLPATARPAQDRNLPTEALTLFSRGLHYQDLGDNAKAVEFYNKAIAKYPDFVEARDSLRKLRGS